MTSSPHAPYILGYTRATMVRNKGTQRSDPEQILKTGPSSDCRLQFAYMKPELLVIVDQLRYGEYVLSPCTHRPSHHPSWMHLKTLN